MQNGPNQAHYNGYSKYKDKVCDPQNRLSANYQRLLYANLRKGDKTSLANVMSHSIDLQIKASF